MFNGIIQAKSDIEQCITNKSPVLNLSNLAISSLPEGIFEHLAHVKKINLENTGITCLPSGIDKLELLTSINLKNNPINDYYTLYTQLAPLSNCSLELTKEQEREYVTAILNKWVYRFNWASLDYWRDDKLPTRKAAAKKILNCLNEETEVINISCYQLTELPDSFANLTNLKALNISKNKLTALPESFGKLTNLERLDISSNNLATLPESFCKLTNLKRLDISDNKLTALPESFANLTSLNKLNISFNKLTTLPVLFSRLTNLSWLDISHNEFAKAPEFIKNYQNLKH